MARTRLAVVVACLVGIPAGIGAFAFRLCEGLFVSSADPRACMNCHTMNAQYDEGQKSGHRHTATCVACHLQDSGIAKWVTKADHGFRQSVAFTLQDFKKPIEITPGHRPDQDDGPRIFGSAKGSGVMGKRVSGGRKQSGTQSRTSSGEAARVPALDEGLASLRVRDLMVRSLVTVAHDAGLGTAENLMRTRRIRHLPVLNRARRLVGILTDRDLRRALLDPALHERPRQLPGTLERIKVRDVMTIGTLAVRPEMDVREAARIMHERDIGALPVLADGNRVVGMLTATDVMQYIVSGPARGTRKVQRPRSR